MATFKVGQRVRIVNPQDSDCGKEGTVLSIAFGGADWYEGAHAVQDLGYGIYYSVDVDGVGSRDPEDGREYAYVDGDLTPLTPPAADSWALAKVLQVTKPQHTEPVVKAKERV